MNKRSPNSRVPIDCGIPSQPRRHKKRSSRKNSATNESWYNNDRDSHEPSEDEVPGMEYTSMYWQQPRLPQTQPHPVHNGQRLFTAMSDPSVCGYSAVPVTYAMEPVSLPPMYRLYQPVVRPNYRTFRGRPRSSITRMQNGPPCNEAPGNGFSSLQENGWSHSTPMAYQNGDYASLPPTANIDNKDNRDELNSEHRRYSDPGLGPAELPPNSKSEDTDSCDSSSSITTVGKNNKLFLTLIEQMTKMKETNSQLFKELYQAKSDLETVKTELNQFKQNVPSDYQPGMLSDIIKEIRDASRIKEEAMLSKIKLLMDSQQSQRSVDLEQLKNQLDKVRREKEESEERIAKLEKEVASLRLSLNSESREIAAFEEENLALRRELQEARASRNLAESHATKCVNAVVAVRPVTPVNFDSPYSLPRITSTPVRTTFDTTTSTDPASSPVVTTATATATTTTTTITADLHLGDESRELHEILDCLSTSSPPLEEDESTVLASSQVDTELHSRPVSNQSSASEFDEEDGARSGRSSSSGNNAVHPGDSFSTNNILTSSVPTAPTRATYTTTYTTAYI